MILILFMMGEWSNKFLMNKDIRTIIVCLEDCIAQNKHMSWDNVDNNYYLSNIAIALFSILLFLLIKPHLWG